MSSAIKVSHFYLVPVWKIPSAQFLFSENKKLNCEAIKHVTHLNGPRSDQSGELFRWQVMRGLVLSIKHGRIPLEEG